jgi:uncharacterized protein (DUF58 family)
MPRQQNSLTTRPIPLIGFLCLMAGGGMLYSSRGIARLFDESGTYLRVTGGLIGLSLMLWGLRLISARFSMRTGQHVGRLNRNRVMLPREGMMYLLVMIVAFVAALTAGGERGNMLMLVFSFMAGPFVVNGWVIFSLLKKNHVRRRLPRRAMAGDLVSVELTLANDKLWFSTWLMVVRDHVSRDRHLRRLETNDEALEPSVLFASVRPKSSRTACYQFRPGHRGRYLFGPLEVSTRFPLGLVERGYMTDVRDELLVHPQIGVLLPARADDRHLAAELVQRPVTQRGVFEDEFHHLRDYRPGDNPRDIHWRTSARRNGLMVREFHQSRDRGLIVVIELWQPERPALSDLDRVELAVSFAATICVNHLRQTRGVEQTVLVSGRTSLRLKAESGGSAMESILDRLAVVQGGAADTFADLVVEAGRAITAVTRVVLITTRPRDLTIDELPYANDLPGAEVYHATPKELSQWFTLDDGIQKKVEANNGITRIEASPVTPTPMSESPDSKFRMPT